MSILLLSTRSLSSKLVKSTALLTTRKFFVGSLHNLVDNNAPKNQLISVKVNNVMDSTSLLSRQMATSAGSDSHGHNHSKLWSLERYLSIGLLGVIPAAFLVPNPALDYLLALSLVTHVHWGAEAIVVDYIRPAVFGPVIPKVALAAMYLLSALALGGLFYFNYTDVGLTTAIRMTAKM